jgi:DNA sulfur modification protein DndC
MTGDEVLTNEPSRLTRAYLDSRHAEIREVYLSDNRPWVIGYSGGKDSTVALQLIWYALAELPKEKLTKSVFIISSDTLVETPKIVDYITRSLENMNIAAKRLELPFSAHKVSPEIHDSFWVNLIGRGYPAPSNKFRWCTERLKIDPANKFILDKVAEHGEVVVVLGVRKSESATRAQVMSLHRLPNSLLSRHSTLPNAFVYTPVADFGLGDVWTYLLQVTSPWGNNNRELVTLYRNAQAGECPLVVDKTTPSCGNSRFGCWVCTVVNRDSSMESMIENGETWMEPLLGFRNKLAETQDPAVKRHVRQLKRRNGRVTYGTNGKIIPGPYTPDFRKHLLRELFRVQKDVAASGEISQLISKEELEEIRRIWRSETQDWEDSVPRIFHEIMGHHLDWNANETPVFGMEDRKILDSICARESVSSDMVARLLDVERDLTAMSRRSSVNQKISAVLEEDWRSAAELSALDRDQVDDPD